MILFDEAAEVQRAVAIAIANFNTGIGFAFNVLRTLTLGVGFAVALVAGQLAAAAGTWLGVAAAASMGLATVLAVWFIWRPRATELTQAAEPSAQQNMICVQRQVRSHNLKRLLSGAGAVFGACVILLTSVAVLASGSYIAGILFFFSGVMAMRAAWTLLWVQRGTWG